MIAPTIIGVLGLIHVLWPLNDTDRVIGWLMVLSTVAFWIVAFTINPKPHPKWMTVVAGMAGAAFGVGVTLVAVTR
jgi:hypothetical protein